MPVLSDERTFVEGDGVGWLDDVYRSHFGAVFRVCRSILWDREEAADATHDVFARAARTRAPLAPNDHTRAWLLLVARNHCIDLLRRRQRRDRALVKLAPGSGDGSDPERMIINRNLVKAVFAELSPRERRLLWHSAVERRSLREIATELQLSYVAAAQALRRARLRAAAIAAKVAAVLALLRLRRFTLLLPSANRTLLLALVPAVAVSIQASVQPQPSARPAPPTVVKDVAGVPTTSPARGVSPSTPPTAGTAASPLLPSVTAPPDAAATLASVISALSKTAMHRPAAEGFVRGLISDLQTSGASAIMTSPVPTRPSPLDRLR